MILRKMCGAKQASTSRVRVCICVCTRVSECSLPGTSKWACVYYKFMPSKKSVCVCVRVCVLTEHLELGLPEQRLDGGRVERLTHVLLVLVRLARHDGYHANGVLPLPVSPVPHLVEGVARQLHAVRVPAAGGTACVRVCVRACCSESCAPRGGGGGGMRVHLQQERENAVFCLCARDWATYRSNV